MKTTIATFIFTLFCLTALQAQNTNKAVQQIRKEYTRVKSQIAVLEKAGYAGELYCMHITDNVYGKSYPASGNYKANYWYYYTLEGEQPPKLRMVIETTKVAGKTDYLEALFDEDSENIFVFVKYGNDNIENRIYSKKNGIILYSKNNVEKSLNDLSEETIWMHRAAIAHKERFNLFMYAH